MKEIRYLPQTTIEEGMDLLKSRIMNNLACEDSNRFFLLSLLINTLLIQFMEARGITKHSGDQASGKTAATKYISKLIYGDSMVTTSSVASSYSEGVQSPLIVEDNLEIGKMTREMLDFLLLVATGVVRRKRKAGTDSENIYERMCTQVIVTAIEPFSVDELISRTTDIEFDSSRFNSDFVGETEILSLISNSRDQIWSGIFKLVAHEILPDFKRKRTEALKWIREEHPKHSKDRLNELYACLFIICQALVKYIPHPEHSKLCDTPKEAAEWILQDWIFTQDELSQETSSETNEVLHRLEELLKEYRNDPKGFQSLYHFQPEETGSFDDPDKISFIITARELFSAFQMLAKMRGGSCPFANTKQLGVRIKNAEQILRQNGWDFEKDHRKSRGERSHRFTKRLKR